jgi:hypothetical protein
MASSASSSFSRSSFVSRSPTPPLRMPCLWVTVCVNDTPIFPVFELDCDVVDHRSPSALVAPPSGIENVFQRLRRSKNRRLWPQFDSNAIDSTENDSNVSKNHDLGDSGVGNHWMDILCRRLLSEWPNSLFSTWLATDLSDSRVARWDMTAMDPFSSVTSLFFVGFWIC